MQTSINRLSTLHCEEHLSNNHTRYIPCYVGNNACNQKTPMNNNAKQKVSKQCLSKKVYHERYLIHKVTLLVMYVKGFWYQISEVHYNLQAIFFQQQNHQPQALFTVNDHSCDQDDFYFLQSLESRVFLGKALVMIDIQFLRWIQTQLVQSLNFKGSHLLEDSFRRLYTSYSYS